METTPLMPFPLPEETTTEVEEDKLEENTLRPTTRHRHITKANQERANKPNKGGLKEEAEEEDNHPEEVREERMELKPPNHRTPDQNVCSVECRITQQVNVSSCWTM